MDSPLRRAALVLVVATSLAGCSSKPPKPTPAMVSGRVTLDGLPVTSGTVTFLPELREEQGGRPGIGRIGSDGRYTLGNANPEKPIGAIPGRCRVTVIALEPFMDEFGRPSAKMLLPDRYATIQSTPIEVIVKPGDNDADLHLISTEPSAVR
jgi:hypothetical protein